MNEPLDPNRQPDQLEETLRNFYQTPTPPAEFVERLDQQLRARQVALRRSRVITWPPIIAAWNWLSPPW